MLSGACKQGCKNLFNDNPVSDAEDRIDSLETTVGSLPTLTHGTYTPIGNAFLGLTSVNPIIASFSRVGDSVRVSVTGTLRPSSAGANLVFSLTNPVPGNTVSGVCSVGNFGNELSTLHILASGGNALLFGTINASHGTGNVRFHCVWGYRVV